MPNCKLTIKILKQHLEVSSDVESFIVNGESSRIRCQRIINLLLVQLDTTRDYKNFCNLFNMISVMTDLPDKLRKGIMIIRLYVVIVVSTNVPILYYLQNLQLYDVKKFNFKMLYRTLRE